MDTIKILKANLRSDLYVRKLITTLPIVLAFCLISTQAKAQLGYEVGGWLGTAYYFGDLNPNYNLEHPGYAGGLYARVNQSRRLNFRLGVNYARIEAQDAWSKETFNQQRNLSFQTPILEGYLLFEFNFLDYIHGDPNLWFTPYLFGGFSMYYFNPKTEYQGELVELRVLGTEGQFQGEEYYAFAPAIPLGVGMKWSLSTKWSINVEVSTRMLFNDYLDDVSGTYPDPTDLQNRRGNIAVALSDRSLEVGTAQLGAPGRQRGNSKTNDSFNFIGIGLVYNIHGLMCPEISRK